MQKYAKIGVAPSCCYRASSSRERCEPNAEEVEAREGDHVDGQLAEVGVELAREPEAGGDARHGEGDQVVQVPIGGGGELQGAEADVIEGLIVDAEGVISVLHQLVHRESGIVWLHHGVRHLRGWCNRVGVHDPVWIFLPALGDEEGAHARASAAPKGVGHLEALQAVAGLGLLPHDVQDVVDQLCSLRVVPLGPIVAGSALAKAEIVGAEDPPVGSCPDGVHGAGLQVDQDGPGDVLATRGLIVVDLDPLQLEVGVTVVLTVRVDAVLVRDDLPELCPNLTDNAMQ